MLPYGKQSISPDDVEAVARVLQSDFLTCGPRVDTFERDFAEFVGAKHAIAVCNATAALHLAMRVADIGRGDRVVTAPITFLASANCAAYVGATPDFCDIEAVSYNLDPARLEAGWRDDTKAVVAVDYGGQSADMPAIAEIARRRGAVVVEDASHGAGGRFVHAGASWSTGAHPWADMTVFSFHPVKTMTTGEGGMIVTQNDEYARRARLLRTHGMERSADRLVGFGATEGPLAERGTWVYEMHELGYNYRITDLQCALGSSQLKRLPDFIKRRREIVAEYNAAFAGIPTAVVPRLRCPADLPHISWHLYTLQIDFGLLGKSRTEVMAELRERGVGTQVLYIPVHLQPWYRRTYGFAPGQFPVAEKFYSRCLSIPLYPGMTDEDVNAVIKAVREITD